MLPDSAIKTLCQRSREAAGGEQTQIHQHGTPGNIGMQSAASLPCAMLRMQTEADTPLAFRKSQRRIPQEFQLALIISRERLQLHSRRNAGIKVQGDSVKACAFQASAQKSFGSSPELIARLFGLVSSRLRQYRLHRLCSMPKGPTLLRLKADI